MNTYYNIIYDGSPSSFEELLKKDNSVKIHTRNLQYLQSFTEIIETNAKNGVVLEAIESSFKRAYGEVEDNIIIYIERLKT